MAKNYYEDEPTLSEKINLIFDTIEKGDKKKIKKLKLMGKAKTRKGKIKKGYIGIIKVDQNRNISGEKVQIEGSAFTQKDGLTHATDGQEIYWWEGKFPIIIQPSWKNNPVNIEKAYSEIKNETYGQPYIKAKMLRDVIVQKKKTMSLMWIIGLIVVGYLIYSQFFGGG